MKHIQISIVLIGNNWLEGVLMKKIIWYLLAIFLFTIIVCFSLGKFMAGYVLIFLLLSALIGIGNLYGTDNSVYLHGKGYYDDYDQSKRPRK